MENEGLSIKLSSRLHRVWGQRKHCIFEIQHELPKFIFVDTVSRTFVFGFSIMYCSRSAPVLVPFMDLYSQSVSVFHSPIPGLRRDVSICLCLQTNSLSRPVPFHCSQDNMPPQWQPYLSTSDITDSIINSMALAFILKLDSCKVGLSAEVLTEGLVLV